MHGARHPAVALQFADVADIDEHHVVAAMQLDGVFGRKRLDALFGLLDQAFDADVDFLRHASDIWRSAAFVKPRRTHGSIAAMAQFSALDLTALGLFLLAWLGYAILVEWSAHGRDGLNARMDAHREGWMERMLARDMRMLDGQIMASLQNGTAFFASTSLIAIGGTLTLLRSTDDVLTVVATMPLGIETTRTQWEMKTVGLAVIFVYAFFKFAWSYRLYNYVAILIGAMPEARDRSKKTAQAHARRTAKLCKSAGRHFNRGQRAFFFALGYLGWFVSPWLLMATTAAVVVVMWRRQFVSDARDAIVEN